MRIITVRNFAYPTNLKRYLYSSVDCTVAGQTPPQTSQIGTLIVAVKQNVSTRGFVPIATRAIWGGSVGVFGLLLPDAGALANMFAGPSPSGNTQGTCLISISLKRPYSGIPFTFTEVTNLGPLP